MYLREADQSVTMGRVITGPQFQAVRARSHLTNKQLAKLLEVSPSTISNWLRDGVVGKSEADVEDKLGVYLPRESGSRPLESMSSAALFAQVQQILGILAARMEDPTPTGGVGSGFGQEASEVRERTVHGPTVPRLPSGGVIRGHAGMPPRTAD